MDQTIQGIKFIKIAEGRKNKHRYIFSVTDFRRNPIFAEHAMHSCDYVKRKLYRLGAREYVAEGFINYYTIISDDLDHFILKLKDLLSETMIFDNYKEFKAYLLKHTRGRLIRRKINGVSPAYAKENPNYKVDNFNNMDCWNGKSCFYYYL